MRSPHGCAQGDRHDGLPPDSGAPAAAKPCVADGAAARDTIVTAWPRPTRRWYTAAEPWTRRTSYSRSPECLDKGVSICADSSCSRQP